MAIILKISLKTSLLDVFADLLCFQSNILCATKNIQTASQYVCLEIVSGASMWMYLVHLACDLYNFCI